MQNSDLELLLIHKLGRYDLTMHQLRISLAILDGLSNEQIAQKMNIKLKAVKSCITMIYKKIECKSRSEFITFMYKQLIFDKKLPLGQT